MEPSRCVARLFGVGVKAAIGEFMGIATRFGLARGGGGAMRLNTTSRTCIVAPLRASLRVVDNQMHDVHENVPHRRDVGLKRDPGRAIWWWTISASLVPWLSIGACKAMELLDATGSAETAAEAAGIEAVDVGTVLAGDIAMLVVAPLVVYAAVKFFWNDKDDAKSNQLDEHELLDPLLGASVRSVVTSSSFSSNKSSKLSDPELQALATAATQNVTAAISDAKKHCAFQANLKELAVKHGGAQENNGWILEILKKNAPSADVNADLEAQFAIQASGLSNQALCDLLVMGIAQHAALHEIKILVQELKRKQMQFW